MATIQFQRVRGTLRDAIRAAEQRLGLTRGDRGYMSGDWPCQEWARRIAYDEADIGEGHVAELIADLERKSDAARTPEDDRLTSPGGYAVVRLKKLYWDVAGKRLPRRPR